MFLTVRPVAVRFASPSRRRRSTDLTWRWSPATSGTACRTRSRSSSVATSPAPSTPSVRASRTGPSGIPSPASTPLSRSALDLIDALNPGAADTVVVSGATGGVGAFAVQLAAARGARVVATARPGGATVFVRSLGAAAVVDYTGGLAVALRAVTPDGVTKVVHAAGDPAVLGSLLVANGQFASVVSATAEQVGREDVTVTGVMTSYTPDKLAALLEQVAAGQLTVPVAATHPLASAADALSDFGSGKLGKIVVTP